MPHTESDFEDVTSERLQLPKADISILDNDFLQTFKDQPHEDWMS
jgi:hypothetical protein